MQRLVVGFVVSAAATAALVGIARTLAARGALAFERPLLERFAHADVLPFSWAIWIESPGNAVILWPLVLLSVIACAWRRKTFRALTLLAGFALTDALVLIGWTSWNRRRPDFIAGGAASPTESFSAFPSGHVAQTMVAYGLLIWFWSRVARPRERVFAWGVFVLLNLAVGVSRIRLGAHWPSDVVAGAVVGGMWLYFLIAAVRAGERSPDKMLQ